MYMVKSVRQEIPRPLWNLKIRYSVHNSPPLDIYIKIISLISSYCA